MIGFIACGLFGLPPAVGLFFCLRFLVFGADVGADTKGDTKLVRDIPTRVDVIGGKIVADNGKYGVLYTILYIFRKGQNTGKRG